MSRRRYPKSHAAIARQRARDVEELLRVGLLLLVFLPVFGVLWATGLGTAILGWAGDLLLDQIDKMGNTQPE